MLYSLRVGQRDTFIFCDEIWDPYRFWVGKGNRLIDLSKLSVLHGWFWSTPQRNMVLCPKFATPSTSFVLEPSICQLQQFPSSPPPAVNEPWKIPPIPSHYIGCWCPYWERGRRNHDKSPWFVTTTSKRRTLSNKKKTVHEGNFGSMAGFDTVIIICHRSLTFLALGDWMVLRSPSACVMILPTRSVKAGRAYQRFSAEFGDTGDGFL